MGRQLPIRAFAVAAMLMALGWSVEAAAEDVPVTDATELIDAIANASPGDTIILGAGNYFINQNLNCNAAGTETEPITVRAENLGDALIQFDALEGFKVNSPHWVFENLEIEGVCGNDSDCEHAWHIVGAADNTVVRNNVAFNFNAQIKANGSGDPRVFPDDVLVEGNEFYNDAPRNTANPVTPIDVVGGRRWIIRANFIHDHAKGGGNNISYAAFLKGNSRSGVFERNLVMCEMAHTGQIRLGLSFGGGGTGPDSVCEDGTCTPEHQNGIMRNNIIVNCPADVGVYVNEGQNVKLYNNTLFNTSGIDIRFGSSTADLRNNLLDGRIRERDGGSITTDSNNLTQVDMTGWFADPGAANFSLVDGSMFVDQGETLSDVRNDYCAVLRDDGSHDIGAVEFIDGMACDTTRPVLDGGGPPIMMDMDSSGDMAQDMSEDVAADMNGDAGEDMTGDTATDTAGDVVSDAETDGPPLLADDVDEGGGGDDGCGCQVRRADRGWPLPALAGLLLLGVIGMRRRL